MNQIIRTVEKYKPTMDIMMTIMLIRLANGKEVYAEFEHEGKTITNKELVTKLKRLADYIESEHA